MKRCERCAGFVYVQRDGTGDLECANCGGAHYARMLTLAHAQAEARQRQVIGYKGGKGRL